MTWRLLNAIAYVESRNNNAARSPKGAVGKYQLNPKISAWCGVDPLDPRASRACARRLLLLHLKRFGGRLDLALASYVFGAGNVRRYEAEGLPLPTTVHRYVARVMHRAGIAWEPPKGVAEAVVRR